LTLKKEADGEVTESNFRSVIVSVEAVNGIMSQLGNNELLG